MFLNQLATEYCLSLKNGDSRIGSDIPGENGIYADSDTKLEGAIFAGRMKLNMWDYITNLNHLRPD